MDNKIGEPITLDKVGDIKIDKEFSWPHEESLRITMKMVETFDNMVINEVATHFDCDLSDFKEWLEIKKRVANGHGTNADRIRSMTDEELAEWMSANAREYTSFRYFEAGVIEDYGDHGLIAKCWLDWLKEEAK